jgi:TonB family protein
MAVAQTSRIRPLGRGTSLGGIAATVVIHVGLAGLVYFAHMKSPPRPEAARDMIVTKLVSLGKPREKFWLPRITQPPIPKAPVPTIKVTDDPNAAPAPKEAPKVEDATISKDLRRALQRANSLAQLAAAEEEPEGSATGSPMGTSNVGTTGDEYATQIFEAIRRNWTTPTGLVSDAELATLRAEFRLSVSADGTLGAPRVNKASGNDYFDDSCVQAIRATGHVPPPPPALAAKFKRGFLLDFAGKDLAR